MQNIVNSIFRPVFFLSSQKAKRAEIDSQYRRLITRRFPADTQQRTITAKRNQEIRKAVKYLLLACIKFQPGKLRRLFLKLRQTALQKQMAHQPLCHGKLFILFRIRYQPHLLHTLPPSFPKAWHATAPQPPPAVSGPRLFPYLSVVYQSRLNIQCCLPVP